MPRSFWIRWLIGLTGVLGMALVLSLSVYGVDPSLAQERPTPTNEGLVTETPRPTPTLPATATPAPPTATPLPPTATPAPPTATSIPPTQEPTQPPTQEPTQGPTQEPTQGPTQEPTQVAPSAEPAQTARPAATAQVQLLRIPKTGYFSALAPTGLLVLVLIGAIFGARSLRQRRDDESSPPH